jgi:hypothetical protein
MKRVKDLLKNIITINKKREIYIELCLDELEAYIACARLRGDKTIKLNRSNFFWWQVKKIKVNKII